MMCMMSSEKSEAASEQSHETLDLGAKSRFSTLNNLQSKSRFSPSVLKKRVTVTVIVTVTVTVIGTGYIARSSTVFLL